MKGVTVNRKLYGSRSRKKEVVENMHQGHFQSHMNLAYTEVLGY